MALGKVAAIETFVKPIVNKGFDAVGKQSFVKPVAGKSFILI
jgi:hypothetical protein